MLVNQMHYKHFHSGAGGAIAQKERKAISRTCNESTQDESVPFPDFKEFIVTKVLRNDGFFSLRDGAILCYWQIR